MKIHNVIFLMLLIVSCGNNSNKPNEQSEVVEIQGEEILHTLEEENDMIWYEKYLSNQDEIYKSISLPFSSDKYIDNIDRDNVYPFYYPSDLLSNYFISIDYEGEEYKCYIVSADNANLTLLTWILRGDSEYYLLILLTENNVKEYKEIGKGEDDTVSFIIEKDLSIKAYNRNGNLQKFQLEKNKILIE